MTPQYSGSIVVYASTWTEALEEARVKIKKFVGDGELFMVTNSQPVVYLFTGEPIGWKTEVDWWVLP